MKSANDGERAVAKRIKFFADGLKVKTWWVAAAVLVSEKDTAMCDFSLTLVNCSFSFNKFAKKQVPSSH